MERLTKRGKEGVAYWNGANGVHYSDNQGNIYGNAITKLATYEDAEEQGLLLRLPCKAGDTLYEASRQWKTVMARTVAAIVICNNNIWIRNGCGNTFEYGVEVFLTKAEAEAALAEMEK